MGCASSKANADVAVADVYCPPPTSLNLVKSEQLKNSTKIQYFAIWCVEVVWLPYTSSLACIRPDCVDTYSSSLFCCMS
jgi:hypothetical protein